MNCWPVDFPHERPDGLCREFEHYCVDCRFVGQHILLQVRHDTRQCWELQCIEITRMVWLILSKQFETYWHPIVRWKNKPMCSLQWRRNECECDSNHRSDDCLLNRLFRLRTIKKHQSSASLAFVWGIHRWPVNFSHQGPVTRKMYPLHDVIIYGTKIVFTVTNTTTACPFVSYCPNEYSINLQLPVIRVWYTSRVWPDIHNKHFKRGSAFICNAYVVISVPG